MEDVKNIPIDTIGLTVRSLNALRRAGVRTLGDMLSHTEESLSQIRNLGKKSILEILEKIEQYRNMQEMGAETELIQRSGESQDLNFDALLQSSEGQKKILAFLEEKQISLDALDLLSARTYNLLMLGGYESLAQIAFLTQDQLMAIPRMDEAAAEEIRKRTMTYILQLQGEITAFVNKPAPVKLSDMVYMPQYQGSILEFVQRNDIFLPRSTMSTRSRNQLQKNGYLQMSNIIFLTPQQIKRIPSLGSSSIAEIQQFIQDYLKKHETRMLAYCSGDTSVLWDDTAISKKILRLYNENPFAGYSLKEFRESLELPDSISETQLKRVIGKLIGDRELEYVDFRCYRVYEKFQEFVESCEDLDERTRDFLRKRLQGVTLEAIGQEYDRTKERVRQILKSGIKIIRARHETFTGKKCFDEEYYQYFYETYAFDKKEATRYMGIPESVWKYLDLMDVKPGKTDLLSALDDPKLETGLRLKIKNYLNRDKFFVDGMWIEKNHTELERVVARKFCREDTSFSDFVRMYNDYLDSEDVTFDEKVYITEPVLRYRRASISESRFVLSKQNEVLRYYDMDIRDYSELLETLNLDIYENVEYSTVKFMNDYPEVMKKYDIRDQYELHNLLRKIVPEGSYHDLRFGRMPHIKFGSFDRDSAILEILIENAPITGQEIAQRMYEEYGFDPQFVMLNNLPNFYMYNRDGIYTVDQKVMSLERKNALKAALTDDFYYIDEVRKKYMELFPDADPEEINSYNLKIMGFVVLSRYVLQNHPSLEAFFEKTFTGEDILDLKPLRKRYAYVQMFYQKLLEMKRNMQVIEFEPNQLLNFRKLERAGVTKEMIEEYCQAVYDFVPDGHYFSIRALRQDGFESELFDLGFSDWFYANLLHTDNRFSMCNMFKSIILYKGKENITIESMLVDRVLAHSRIDVYELIEELTDRFGCTIEERSDVTYRLKNTQIYHDKILDRLYANVDLYYENLEEGGF